MPPERSVTPNDPNPFTPFAKGPTKMKILWINNDGGGYADYVEAAEGASIEQFLGERMPGCTAEDYLIRVNRQPVARDYVLRDGDRVTCTPVKVEGAA